ncbi:hypothetical protein ACKKBF_B03160 [Auxenochlorella protothecoides x Auxenochlorella symbiontica]
MSKTGMEREDWAVYNALYPGVPFQPEHRGQLAARLREIAARLEAPPVVTNQLPQPEVSKNDVAPNRKRRGTKPDLDFASYQTRYVALEILYLGHAYDGFARQESSSNTIEARLFSALERTRLIPFSAPWQSLRYSRAGRTDRGVSALGQVVALELRSSARVGEPLPDPGQELDYPGLLNRALPEDVRVTGWCPPTSPDFSARFSATHREYKYFVVAQPGEVLDLAAMQAAGSAFLGLHDFRNFCKMDVAQVKHFQRRILDFRIEAAGTASGGRRLFLLSLRGTAFLWHQVRCMAAVLLMVGRGKEDPGVVAALLDVGRHPAKPLYGLASEEPLLLSGCRYAPGELRFLRTEANRDQVCKVLGRALDSHLVRASLLSEILTKLGEDECALPSAGRERRARRHGERVPLLQRVREPSYEERCAKIREAGGKLAGDSPDENDTEE